MSHRLSRRAFVGLGLSVAATTATRLVARAPRGGRQGLQGAGSSQGAGSRAGDSRVVEGVEFRWCPAGRFRMGSPASENGRRSDEGPVEVTLSRGFWAGTVEVTQGQWRRLVGSFPDQSPSPAMGEGDDFPMYWVNFDEAERFCVELTRRARASGTLPMAWRASLPSEAQWEYACRAGSTSAFAFGEELDEAHARFDAAALARPARSMQGSTRVGSFPANAWGLHDMHGNVWEWCRDYYHEQLPGGTDPDLSGVPGRQNRDGTYSRVRRGGAWVESAAYNRSAARLLYEPWRRSDHIGFRAFLVETS